MKISPLLFSARALALGSLLLAADACSVSEQVKDKPTGKKVSTEVQENEAYSAVQYRLNFMDAAKLAGQDILFVRQPTDLTAAQQARMQSALQGGRLPLHLLMRVYARNASSTTDIQLKQLEYKLMLDGKEVATGSTGANTPLESNAIGTLPVIVDLNVTPDLLGTRTPAVFAAGLADFTAANRRLTMLIRPTYVGASGRQVPSSSFGPIELVTVKRDVKSK